MSEAVLVEPGDRFGPMHIGRARFLVDSIRSHVSLAMNAISEAYTGRAWIPLGYDSWDDLCSAEFGMQLRLPVPERRALVADLRSEGMSTRAIGSALGIDAETVRRDATAANAAVALVVGVNGKSYQPRPSKPEPSTEQVASRERTRMYGRLIPLWHNTTSNLLTAMTEAVQVPDLATTWGPDDPLGTPLDRTVDRLRELAAAASALADHLQPPPPLTPLRRVK